MSRARSIDMGDTRHWFDVTNGVATVAQLELLASVENIDIDSLLDEGLSQREVITRLREALGQQVIPPEVLERHRRRREEAAALPKCIMCQIDGVVCNCGRSTKHHFVPRWLMKELDNYESYAARNLCTIPVGMARHRDLHMKIAGDKSIVSYLNREQRLFAHKMIGEIKEQHPKIFDLMSGGDPSVSYEAQLMQDYTAGEFSREEREQSLSVDNAVVV